MADLTEARSTKSAQHPVQTCSQPVMVTGGTVFKGGLVQLTTAGLANRAGAANPQIVIGKAMETIEDAAAGQRVRVEEGLFLWNNDDGDPCVTADKGLPAYVVDDNTVANTGSIVAGTILDVTTEGVWVLTTVGTAGPVGPAGPQGPQGAGG